DAGGALVLIARRVPVRVVERLVGSRHGEDDEIVDLALLLGLHPLVGIEQPFGLRTARDAACDLAGEIVDRKIDDPHTPALLGEEMLPADLDAAAKRRHHAEARDNHTSHGVLRPGSAAGGCCGFKSRSSRYAAFFSRNLTASPTVRIVSAASSGISTPNSSSKAITSSTVSRLSAPRSSMKLALSCTFSASTPRCSITIFFTRSPISLMSQNLKLPKLDHPVRADSPTSDRSWPAHGNGRSRPNFLVQHRRTADRQ